MRKIVSVALSLGVLSAFGVGGSFSQARTEASPVQDGERPNIVVIMTDDQDVASLDYMPRVQDLLIDRGVEFTHHSPVYPVCCPSRSAYLSGQVGHNNHVRDNTPPNGGYENLDTSKTLPVFLENAGYATAHLGKYPNGYDGSQHQETNGVPPGYTEWYGSVDPTTYLFYGYVLNQNGVNIPHGAREEDYQTDVLTDMAVDYVDRRAGSDQPFYLDVAYLAPHWEIGVGTSGEPKVAALEANGRGETGLGNPPVPAKRHMGMFAGAKAPRLPSFNEEDVSDKPAFVRNMAPLTERQIAEIDRWYQKRLESLQAVDEGVASIIDAVARAGELDNTYFIFHADNGWLQGEHRIALTKVHAYSESAIVPLIISGPAMKHGRRVQENTSNVDVTATILDLAGAEPTQGHELDGMSLTQYLEQPSLQLERAVFLETTPGDSGYYAVRTRQWKYVEYNNGDLELYDLKADPFELESLHKDPSKTGVIAELAGLLDQFRECAGSDCVVTGIGAS